MNWQEVCANPNLKSLPFKIELNEYGQIVMSPMKVIHSLLQGEIERLLLPLTASGKVFPNAPFSPPKALK